MANRVKYFSAPSFSKTDWESRNPLLLKGEIGYELNDAGTPYKAKVGPGLWNDLPYIEYSYWEDETPVSNPIGDAEGDLSGKSDREIIDLMLNPYQAPSFSNVKNNAGGVYAGTTIFEIGRTWSADTLMQYSISSQENLVGATPININSNEGIFGNDGTDFAVGLNTMSLVQPITPDGDTDGVTEYTITLTATHTNGTSTGKTYVSFYPKILWGSSSEASITPGEWLTLDSKGSYITNIYGGDYAFLSSGYHWLAIPSMLNPGTLTFTDVTDPNAPAGYGMEYMGQVTINNGVGTYSYETYRSTFSITENFSILRVA